VRIAAQPRTDGLSAASKTVPMKELLEVRSHRSGREAELSGNFFVRGAVGDQAHDLSLPRTEVNRHGALLPLKRRLGVDKIGHTADRTPIRLPLEPRGT